MLGEWRKGANRKYIVKTAGLHEEKNKQERNVRRGGGRVRTERTAENELTHTC
jgi:hypothetical protein